MDVIIYTRVSTEDQKENGFSLQDQERRLRKHCQELGRNVVSHYQDDYSAKNFNRPAFRQLLNDIQNKKIKVSQLWCISHDRFSRNALESLNMMQTLKAYGVELQFLENNVISDSPEGLLLNMIHTALPQIDNDIRSNKTKRGLRQAMREGRWVGRAPKGYKNDKVNKTIIIGEDAHFVKRAFKEVVLQIKSIDQTRLELNREGFICSKQQFYNLLKNPFYIGYIKILAWRDEEEEMIKGLHEPIISEELFNQVQVIFKKGKRKDVRPSKYNEKFPLRGHLICNKCGNKLTASSSKGRKKYYDYYHCQNGCSERQDASLANEEFLIFLESFKISEEVEELYSEIIRDVFREKEGSKESKIKSFRTQISSFKERLERLDDRFIDGDIESDNYNRMSKKIKKEIFSLEAQIKEVEGQETNLEKHFRFGLSMMKNLSYFYKIAEIPIKQKIIGSIFPEKLIFDGENYRTERLNSFISLISSESKGLKRFKTKQATKISGLSNMAPPLGLEPRTL
ncbi:recombinase family protein [Algoriphagus aestuarii]|nr:recombinase family protein [Algoriphagus aestuarii]